MMIIHDDVLIVVIIADCDVFLVKMIGDCCGGCSIMVKNRSEFMILCCRISMITLKT